MDAHGQKIVRTFRTVDRLILIYIKGSARLGFGAHDDGAARFGHNDLIAMLEQGVPIWLRMLAAAHDDDPSADRVSRCALDGASATSRARAPTREA